MESHHNFLSKIPSNRSFSNAKVPINLWNWKRYYKSWSQCSSMRSRCILPLCQVQVHSATMQLQSTWTSAMAIASHDKCVYHCFSYSRKFMGTLRRVKDKFIDYGRYVDCDLLGERCICWLRNVDFFSPKRLEWLIIS